MSSLMDGINNAYALTAQINSLKSLRQAGLENPEAVKYALEKNFNEMLNDLISPPEDEDQDKKDDFFSFLMTSHQASLQSLQKQGILDMNSIPDTSSPEYLKALYNLGQLY
ncbi:hypothetical protein AMJ44_08980 [candidate division WOR-1 bacterium DG_54_3]|jgi:hypothetical protein|uniref:Uncharacterized protein n=1 Tax=candidate division WOR-1 bacterium DG_54_3 TaxID=1703775 RepID=A0A0S7XUS7_UNCSA|nr:MAG: hypothetical protein AMJ44_08980 [candidate division WOR-1 bacterium DG_54_3]